MGYMVLVIPSYFLIRMVRRSNFYEREGEGSLYRMVICCVFGTEKESAPSRPIFGFLSGTSTRANAIKLIVCVVGIQGSFLTWGVLQEKIMTKQYGDPNNGARFVNSEFLVFMNRVVALLLAGFYIYCTGNNFNGPFYKYSFCSLSNICSSWCQYEALKFVSFPTQVLVKTSKMIPVMIMGKFVSKKVYAYYEYFIAILISLGVSLFLLSSTSERHASAATTVSGLLLMLGYMAFDSFTSNWQSQLYSDYKISSMQMMFNINVFSSVLTAMPLIISGGLFYSFAFIQSFPAFGKDCIIMSMASAVGQIFLYFTIAEFGPLVFTTIMVTRQMVSILLSCMIYGHTISSQSGFGVIIVFTALLFQIYAKYRIRQKQQQQRIATREGSDMA